MTRPHASHFYYYAGAAAACQLGVAVAYGCWPFMAPKADEIKRALGTAAFVDGLLLPPAAALLFVSRDAVQSSLAMFPVASWL